LQSALERLAEADLLIAQGAGPQASYRFKHALIQDAAYESLLKNRRQALHRRAAEILLGQPERAAAEPEAIAHHFTQAGLDDLAIEWWGKAGDQALRRSAFQEAIAHLGKAIEMADKAGGGQAAGVSGQQLHMHVAYGNALIAARGHGAPETTAAFAHAHDSAVSDEDAPERFGVIYGLWVGCYVRGDLTGMREPLGRFPPRGRGASGMAGASFFGCSATIASVVIMSTSARGSKEDSNCEPFSGTAAATRYASASAKSGQRAENGATCRPVP